MLILISPSKTFTQKPLQPGVKTRKPLFDQQAQVLVKDLQSKSQVQLSKLLQLSDQLVELNYQRYQNWDNEGAYAAGWTYRGETYFGLGAEDFTAEQIKYADEHLRIISGLYGLLRITDEIKPYRLEANTKYKGKWGADLYAYWQAVLAEHVNNSGESVIVGCASDGYLKAVVPKLNSDIQLIIPKFLQHGPDGKLKSRMNFTKWSRGLMARWIVINQIENIDDLRKFDLEGYQYDSANSTPEQPIFVAPKGMSLKGRYTKT